LAWPSRPATDTDGLLAHGPAKDLPIHTVSQRPLLTPRLWLEPQLPSHAPAMFKLLSDPVLYRFEDEPPKSVAWLARRYERLALRQSPDGLEHWLNWVLRRRDDAVAVGYVQATVRADGRALVAYVLGSPYWGQGLASEAVQAMLVELAGVWRVRLALAVFKRGNQRSRSLLLRLGFGEADAGFEALAAAGLGPQPDEDLLLLWLTTCVQAAAGPVADCANHHTIENCP
jgi:ribosomal-protein-alanine N-acetyltransferase